MSADHDPLCPRYDLRNVPKGYLDHITAVCLCDLFARVRADERQQARQRVESRAAAMYAPPRALMFIDDAADAAGGDA